MTLFPMARDGWRFVVPLGLAGVGLVAWSPGLFRGVGVLCLLLAVFCAFFFRDFNRFTPADSHALYSPADGRVLEIKSIQEGPYSGRLLVRIFLSVFNVHVQRVPADGVVESIRYKKGTFLDARDPRAHIDNEQNEVVFSTPVGSVVVTQIAGLIARRIVCWVNVGDRASQGGRYGLIRFGSQVDVVMPSGLRVLIEEGQKVQAGITVLARKEESK